MNRQMKGIALILLAILLTITYGGRDVFDLDFDWSLVFTLLGLVGTVLVFRPEKRDK